MSVLLPCLFCNLSGKTYKEMSKTITFLSVLLSIKWTCTKHLPVPVVLIITYIRRGVELLQVHAVTHIRGLWYHLYSHTFIKFTHFYFHKLLFYLPNKHKRYTITFLGFNSWVLNFIHFDNNML